MTNQNPSERRDALSYQIAIRMASVAGMLVVVICALLLYDYTRRQAKDPLDDGALKTLQAALAQQPTNEALKEQVRTRDLQVRREYFRRRSFIAIGAGLLLAFAVIFALALRVAVTINRRLPHPQAAAAVVDADSQWTPLARWAVAGAGAVFIAAAVVLSLSFSSVLQHGGVELASNAAAPSAPTANVAAASPAAQSAESAPSAASAPTVSSAVAVSAPAPSDEETHKMWGRFRGPNGAGVSAYANVPTSWDGAAGKNVLWKTPIPLPGNNSPIVWGKRVFLTGANEKQREVLCFDADSGKLLWRQPAPSTPQSTAQTPRVNEDTGYAASTAATDGRRVYAIFANGDLAAFDMDGKTAWSKSLGIPENFYGFASSLCMYKNLLIVQYDQGSVRKPKSKLYAFDSASGKIVWQMARPVPNSWSSPIVIRNGAQDQIVTAADPWVIAYQPSDGAELWRAKCLRTDIGPSPVFCDGKVYVANDNCDLSAIRADGKGDVTKTHILWKGEDGMPDTCSPLATKDFVFLLASFGTLTCYDAVKGEMLWSEDIDGNFSASPGLVGDRLYLQSTEGKMFIVALDREKYKLAGEAELGEECVTSPVFQDGRLYLRGKDHLFCIGSK